MVYVGRLVRPNDHPGVRLRIPERLKFGRDLIDQLPCLVTRLHYPGGLPPLRVDVDTVDAEPERTSSTPIDADQPLDLLGTRTRLENKISLVVEPPVQMELPVPRREPVVRESDKRRVLIEPREHVTKDGIELHVESLEIVGELCILLGIVRRMRWIHATPHGMRILVEGAEVEVEKPLVKARQLVVE